MKAIQKQAVNFQRRKTRIRAKISGTAERPRLAIFKSHKYIYAQVIDDTKGTTIVSTDSRKVTGKTPLERAGAVGTDIAKKAIAAKITKVVFDRAGYLYAGKIKTVAESARQGGLEF
ncbi:MAG TPA: 50S ribosomal protein L18 [Candidatus Paceibacterota bacterium]